MSIRISNYSGEMQGKVSLPGSKSISNRLLVIKALCTQPIDVINLSQAQDTVDLQSLLDEKKSIYNTGEGGTSSRFFISYAALNQYQCVIDAEGKMKERLISPLVDALNQLGASIIYVNDNKLFPVQLKGYKLKGDIVELRSGESSQFASSLALIAPYLLNGLRIQMKNGIVSESYLKMTLDLMREFGIDIKIENHDIVVRKGQYIPKTIIVESDWSSASYFYMIAAFVKNSKITLDGLKLDSLQGDRKVVEIMHHFGVKTEMQGNSIVISGGGEICRTFEFDFIDCPDLALSIIVVCAALGIDAVFIGLKTLEKKESNRLLAVQTELKKIDVDLIIETNNKARLAASSDIESKLSAIKNVSFNTYSDHRIAMVLATLSVFIKEVEIRDHEVVRKSFPNFWKEIEKLGIKKAAL